MLLPEPLRGLDLMTQSKYHRSNIELELSKNKGVLCRPSPVSKAGFGRTDRTNSFQATCYSTDFQPHFATKGFGKCV